VRNDFGDEIALEKGWSNGDVERLARNKEGIDLIIAQIFPVKWGGRIFGDPLENSLRGHLVGDDSNVLNDSSSESLARIELM
jgi:hypothetical protein